jgi:hypothetical protein
MAARSCAHGCSCTADEHVVPLGKLVGFQRQQLLHDGRLAELEAAVKHHGHHLGAELHHLRQKADFAALFAQALLQHVAPFGVRGQVVQFRLVGRVELKEKGGHGHRGVCSSTVSK